MSDSRYSASEKRRASAALPMLVAALWPLSCGTADHVAVRPPPDQDAGTDTQVASKVNVCPRFDSSLALPQKITPEQTAVLIVTASDPDGNDSQLVFAWSAPNGSFNPSDKPVTNYNCSQPGIQQLTITAKDEQGCSSSLSIRVECIGN
jgi:hypothetical protein